MLFYWGQLFMDNKDFWITLDKLIEESEIVIDRPVGTKHPQYDFIYDMDYGYLENTTSIDGGGIDIWRGCKHEKKCDAVICTIDLVKRDSEIKLLLGCTEEEKEKIMRFYNESKFMKSLMFRRV